MIRVKSPAKSGWAHVSCTWWIPEPKINKPKEMDYVVGIPLIDQKRWKLGCFICRKGKGNTCCIQCRYKRCTKAFHVTCAFNKGLEMKMIDDDDAEGGLQMLSYCPAHGSKGGDVKGTSSPRKRRRMNAGSAGPASKQRKSQ
jgi:protein Jade-1